MCLQLEPELYEAAGPMATGASAMGAADGERAGDSTPEVRL